MTQTIKLLYGNICVHTIILVMTFFQVHTNIPIYF